MIRQRMLAGCGLVLLLAGPAAAQAVEPIGPFAADARIAFPNYKQTDEVAAALGVQKLDLPNRGFGLVFGAHFYPMHLGAVTLGIGGEVITSRRGRTRETTASQTGSTVTTRFSPTP